MPFYSLMTMGDWDPPEDWDEPADMERVKRAYIMERWILSKLDLPASREREYDCYDRERSTEDSNGFLELKNPLVNGSDGQIGRFNLTRLQYEFADWLGWTILKRHEWEILWWGVYPMTVMDGIVESGWHKINSNGTIGKTISWKSLLRETDRVSHPEAIDERNGIEEFR